MKIVLNGGGFLSKGVAFSEEDLPTMTENDISRYHEMAR